MIRSSNNSKSQNKTSKIFNSISEFKVVKEIGKGAFSRVYEVININYKKVFALKRIDMKALTLKDQENVYREIKIHQKLKNEFVIKLIDWFEESGKINIILEYIPEGNLFKLINLKKLEETEIKYIFWQVCQVLKYLHSENILMRDLKPENILINSKLQIKLCDFGWACNSLNSSHCNEKAGTYAYMSPESLMGSRQEFSSDCWSVGILLYELYFNKEPYEGKSCREQLKLIKEKNINFTKEIDKRAKNIIIGLLQSNSNKRLTINELLNSSFLSEFKEKVINKNNLLLNNNIKEIENTNNNISNLNSNNQKNIDEIQKLKQNILKNNILENQLIIKNDNLNDIIKVNNNEIHNYNINKNQIDNEGWSFIRRNMTTVGVKNSLNNYNNQSEVKLNFLNNENIYKNISINNNLFNNSNGSPNLSINKNENDLSAFLGKKARSRVTINKFDLNESQNRSQSPLQCKSPFLDNLKPAPLSDVNMLNLYKSSVEIRKRDQSIGRKIIPFQREGSPIIDSNNKNKIIQINIKDSEFINKHSKKIISPQNIKGRLLKNINENFIQQPINFLINLN